MNVIDYVVWRGDLSFSASPFNEVDNLIFSILSYLDLGDIVTEDRRLPLREVCSGYEKSGRKSVSGHNDPFPLLKACAKSARFGSAVVSDYVCDTDVSREVQFSATLFEFKKGAFFVAFRGTDNSIVGWKEDFGLSFPDTTEGQKEAVAYLDSVGKKYGGKLTVGGHSKGGNLAVYASAFCDPEVKKRITAVYSDDGPGFRENVTESREYRSVIGRVKAIIPEDSLVGVLMSTKKDKKVVKSSASGFKQHYPLTWEVEGPAFVEADRAGSSVFIDETLENWLKGMSDSELKALSSAVFDSLEAPGALTLKELNSHKTSSYASIIKAAAGLPPETRRQLTDSLKKLYRSAKTVRAENKKKEKEN